MHALYNLHIYAKLKLFKAEIKRKITKKNMPMQHVGYILKCSHVFFYCFFCYK